MNLALEAERGNADAQYNLGEMYYHGHSVPKNKKKALHWYTLAAEQGNTHAQYTLGYMHRHGEGVPQNYEAAYKWNRMAAEKGDVDAMHRLGWASREGLGVPQDFVLAWFWFDIATFLGHTYAGTDRDRLAKDMLRSKMGPHISQAQNLSRDWIKNQGLTMKKPYEQEECLTDNELIARWGVSKSALGLWRKYRGLDFIKKPRKKGRYQVLYRLSVVQQFEKDHNICDTDLLTEKELANRWSFSRSSLADWRKAHQLPFCKKGFHNILFRLEDVKQYEKDHHLLEQGELLTEKELAARWGITKQSVCSRRKRNLPFIQKGPRSVLYRLTDVEKYEREYTIGRKY